MADVVDAFPEGTRGLKPRYPWNDWLDGRIWRLVEGEDFKIAPHSFQVSVAIAARRRGVVAETHRVPTENAVYIQALPKSGS